MAAPMQGHAAGRRKAPIWPFPLVPETLPQSGHKPTADYADLLTSLGVLAKSNAAILTALGRAQYREKMARAVTSEVNDVKIREGKGK